MFNSKSVPEGPTFSQATIGHVQIHSGALLLADPMSIYDQVRIEGIAPGKLPVVAQLIRYPEGGPCPGPRVAKIGLRFRPGDTESKRTLGKIDVDSATVVLLDAQTYEIFWLYSDRVGRTGTANHHRRVAQLIEQQFGLKSREVDSRTSEFLQQIPLGLERRITAYLRTFLEYAENTAMYFSVAEKCTFERIQESRRQLWSELVLDELSGGNVLAVSSGFGDGSYAVEGLYRGEELLGAEVEFIGPAQDKILEAFPMLRY